MPEQKIVVRYQDGRIVKGHTTNFCPTAPYFMLNTIDSPQGAAPVTVEIASLKAIFFVRDFAGDKRRQDRQQFVEHQPFQGRPIEVTFQDGEVIVGSAPTYDPSMVGFFLFPADTESNTLRIFAVTASVRHVRWLTPAPSASAAR